MLTSVVVISAIKFSPLLALWVVDHLTGTFVPCRCVTLCTLLFSLALVFTRSFCNPIYFLRSVFSRVPHAKLIILARKEFLFRCLSLLSTNGTQPSPEDPNPYP